MDLRDAFEDHMTREERMMHALQEPENRTTSYGVEHWNTGPDTASRCKVSGLLAAALVLAESGVVPMYQERDTSPRGYVEAVKGRGGSAVGRNRPCPCGSGKKRKRCGCGGA